MKLVGKLSDKREDTNKVIKELKTFAELETMHNELRKRMDIQQLVFDINNFLRVTVLQHKDCFYSEGQYAHCSIEIQQMNNRVRGISFFYVACGVPYAIKIAEARCEGVVDIYL